MLVANMQKEIVEEIEAALNEIYPEKESSKTYLEKVRASKEWLERDVERLKAEIQDAEELLAAYEAILDGNAPNNNEAKKGE